MSGQGWPGRPYAEPGQRARAPAAASRRSPRRPATARSRRPPPDRWPGSAASASRRTPRAWLTAGGTPSVTSTSTSTPNGATICAGQHRDQLLGLLPARDVERAQRARRCDPRRGWRWPPSRRGSIPTSARPRCAGRPGATAPAAVVVARAPSAPTMSWVRCGREVCPPEPVSVMSSWSTAEVIGPTLRASLPTSVRGSQCSAYTSVTSWSTPPSMASSAPPGLVSSAGWKISRTPAGQQVRRRAAGPAPCRRRAGSVVCTS